MWKRTSTAKRVTVTTEWFGTPSPIAKPLKRYGQYLGLPAEQRIEPVESSPTG